ncbi:haloalkane dehalogenase [Rhodoferax saidenbachensis]|uniref:Haloalkane dehalogenase n=1 Tax=Rhodoferax saidenbachensis TaxID=1484693 RepID=A0A1P8KAK0_9BURK|nr:haloalkane dehalogenase [Rhodoferax saidenbachensis]APW43028.1 haloalkane dehalogenase [Rhodoferax saidenbachensis]
MLPTINKARVLRTPDACFAALPDFPYTPHYLELDDLRIGYIDEGPRDAAPVLLMHGEPTWSYLYRKMIPGLVAAGHRVIAPDLVGFGRSDKPSQKSDYSYANHVAWMAAWMERMDLQNATLFCQDWGSLIGLRLVTHNPQRFARVVLANGGLPTGTAAVPRAFKLWRAFARFSPWFPIGRIVNSGCANKLSPAEIAAYDAPFPSSRYEMAARLFPTFVPASPNDPERAANEQAWEVLKQWHKPFLTLFSSRDPITRGGDKIFLKLVPGTANQAHAVTRGAGHFLQEDKGPELAQKISEFIAATPV